MSTIGTYGYIIPDVGDQSSTEWCDNQRFNMSRLDTHNHDGINSAPVASVIVAKSTITLANGDWVLDSDGIYYQDANIPNGASYDNVLMKFLEVSGDEMKLETEWVGPLDYEFRVFCNDNTKDVKVIFV